MLENKIKKYYLQNGLYPTNFNCKHYLECKSVNDNRFFTAGKAPYIGSKYEKTYPKVLFLSLDAGSTEKNPSLRTIEGVRDETENRIQYPNEKGKKQFRKINLHWRETHKFVCYIFNLFNENGSPDLASARSFFAHTNSAKCCLNKEGNEQASKTLFDNCREYILPEIEIFDPDVLITQGNHAFDVIQEALKNKKIKKEQEKNISGNAKSDFYVLKLNNKKLIWIHHSHPNSWRYNLNNHGKFYKKYVEEIFKILPKY